MPNNSCNLLTYFRLKYTLPSTFPIIKNFLSSVFSFFQYQPSRGEQRALSDLGHNQLPTIVGSVCYRRAAFLSYIIPMQ